MSDEDRLIHKDLIWAATEEEVTPTQLEAMRTRHLNAIRPIPSATVLGHEHLMADADRGALLAEVGRLRYKYEFAAKAFNDSAAECDKYKKLVIQWRTAALEGVVRDIEGEES